MCGYDCGINDLKPRWFVRQKYKSFVSDLAVSCHGSGDVTSKQGFVCLNVTFLYIN